MVDVIPRIILPDQPATAKVACPDPIVGHPRLRYAFGHWAVVLVRAGSGSVEHAGHRYDVVPGTLVCSPPGLVTIDLSADAELTVVSLEERGSALREMWRPFTVPLVRRLDAAGVARWTGRLVILERKIVAGVLADADVRALKLALMECFWLGSKPSSQRIVHETFSTLHRELERISSLDDIASNLGYTRNHLSDVMRDFTGASLGAWLTGMRMARAREALALADTPIAQVGAAIGYTDAAYFSRAFRTYHGVPPQYWRIAHRPDDERRASIVTQYEQLALEVVA